jgi:hypothetical protein
MQKNTYPLSLSSYHLNFSYPGAFNLESRIFLTIPYSGEYLQEKMETNLLSICFEMNSVFNLGRNNDFGQDLGLKIMLNAEKILINDENVEENYCSYFKEKEEKEVKTIFFQEEKELYKNIISSFETFILESHGEKWMEFFLENREKYKKKTPVVFLVNDKENLGDEIIKEHERIDKFTTDSISRLKNILNSQSFGYEELIKNNIIYSNPSIVSQVLGGNQEVNSTADELIKINRCFQYYKLSDELKISNDKNRKAKI